MFRSRCAHVLSTAFAALVLMACSSTGPIPPANAQNPASSDIKVMVLMADADNGDLQLGADTSVGRQAISAIKDQLRRYHYQVIDQNTVAQVLDFRQQSEGGYTRAELKEFALRAKAAANEHPEFDVRALVIFSVYPRLEQTTVDQKLVLQISGEIHDADNNTFLAQFGPRLKDYQVGASCTGSACISEKSRVAADDIAAMVAQQARAELAKLTKNREGDALVHRPARAADGSAEAGAGEADGGSGDASVAPAPQYSGLVTDYSIGFRNIAMNEVFRIKRVLDEEFPGAMPGGKTQGSSPRVTYRYRSRAPQDKIYEWLHQLFDQMGYRVGRDVLLNMDGKRFEVQRVGNDLEAGGGGLGPFR